jgi:4-diphosphocytidyl-2-C-methyl-D-erythritol kinase
MKALYEVGAPAKLNLFLHVVGRRADGMHLLQSLFVLIDWADTLHFERRDDGALHRHDLGAGAALPLDDLCIRAARALQTASGCSYGVDIHLDKQVPAGAGMGGGSSDAASTLLALNHLWELHWPRARLAALALQLGADVPFFIGGRNAFVEGIGERLTPVEAPAVTYAVLKPEASIETRTLFAHPRLRRDSAPVILTGSLADASTTASLAGGYGRNDLQEPAEDECPAVAQAARLLQARFGNSRMTGSGSAVFARVGTDAASAATLSADPGLPTGWVMRRCRGLQFHPLRGWADD